MSLLARRSHVSHEKGEGTPSPGSSRYKARARGAESASRHSAARAEAKLSSAGLGSLLSPGSPENICTCTAATGAAHALTLLPAAHGEVGHGVVVGPQHPGVPEDVIPERVEPVQRDKELGTGDPVLGASGDPISARLGQT